MRILSYLRARPDFYAVILCLAGYGFHSIGDATGKFLSQSYDIHFLLVAASAIALVISSVWIYRKKKWKGFFPTKLHLHLLRGILTGVIAIVILNGFKTLPMAYCYAIIFSTPFLVMLMSYFMLGEKFGLHRFLALVIGFAGVLVLVVGKFGEFGYDILFVIGGVILISFNVIIIRKIGPVKLLPRFAFFPYLGILVANLPFLFFAEIPATIPPVDIGLLCLYALAGFSGILLNSHAFTKASATIIVTPFHYTQMFWGVLFGILIFGDYPSLTTFIGTALIIGAGAYTLYREYKLGRHNTQKVDVLGPEV
ncbi:MAG: EamA family transporter [Alphaproteobacteria bacterium]|nr:EamA family transporter [Alphaproteobacteria bacterium]